MKPKTYTLTDEHNQEYETTERGKIYLIIFSITIIIPWYYGPTDL